jgi:hypothetical protein
MKSALLKAYQEHLNAVAKDANTAPRQTTAEDDRVAEIAAKFSEADLRHAVVIRASYERKLAAAARQAKLAQPSGPMEAA